MAPPLSREIWVLELLGGLKTLMTRLIFRMTLRYPKSGIPITKPSSDTSPPAEKRRKQQAPLRLASFSMVIALRSIPLQKWAASKVVELSGFYQYDHVQFSERKESFKAHTVRLKLGFTFNRKVSLSSFVQYSSDADFGLGNFRFRYNPREGNDFFLVYNEGIRLDRFEKTPTAPRLAARTLLLKYSYTFIK